jgi:hypothetical protein
MPGLLQFHQRAIQRLPFDSRDVDHQRRRFALLDKRLYLELHFEEGSFELAKVSGNLPDPDLGQPAGIRLTSACEFSDVWAEFLFGIVPDYDTPLLERFNELPTQVFVEFMHERPLFRS